MGLKDKTNTFAMCDSVPKSWGHLDYEAQAIKKQQPLTGHGTFYILNGCSTVILWGSGTNQTIGFYKGLERFTGTFPF